MRKQLTIYLICMAIAGNVFGQFGGGTGTEGDPYIVSTAAHLHNVRNHLNNALIWFLQDSDISLSDYQTGNGWEPIGGNGTLDKFTGHYDGGGYKITDLVINRPEVDNIGLFGHIGVSDNKTATTIKNLGIETASITGGRGTGALVGRVTGNQNTVVENCWATGTVAGDGATGGLVGSNNSHKQNSAAAESFRPAINKCWADVEVSLRDAGSPGKDKFGGLAGCNQKGMISNSYARGSVTVGNGQRIGGLAGCILYRGIITNSYSTGVVSGSGSTDIGGLLGYAGTGKDAGEVIDCFWDTSSYESSAGGTGKSTTNMKNIDTYPTWDFLSVWKISSGQNDGYPGLLESYTPPTIWTWRETGDNDWNTVSNWYTETENPSTNAPSIGGVAIITNTTTSPVVSSNVSLYKLRMENGAEVSVDYGISVTITGILETDNTDPSPSVSGEGTLILDGSMLQDIPSITFSNLTINNPSNTRLTGDITVNGILTMQRGMLDLNGSNITLGASASLSETETESYSSRVYGESGVITTTRNLNAPTDENIAGLGLVLTSTRDLGSTTIRRGHFQLQSGSGTSIMKWFDINPANNDGLDATLEFHYYLGDVDPVDYTDFSLYKQDKGYTDDEDYDETVPWEKITTTGPGADETFVTASGINSFSRWTIGSADTPMPISLLSFDAAAQDNKVIIQWSTASELNNDFFTIERSTNGRDFTTVTEIQGSGTTHDENHYRTTDTNPIKGLSYYRLRQTDFDGTTEVFQPVSVSIKNVFAKEIKFYPNPGNGKFTITWNGETDLPFKVIDITGRMVYENIASPTHASNFDATHLKPGIYSIIFLTGKKVVKKMVVKK